MSPLTPAPRMLCIMCVCPIRRVQSMLTTTTPHPLIAIVILVSRMCANGAWRALFARSRLVPPFFFFMLSLPAPYLPPSRLPSLYTLGDFLRPFSVFLRLFSVFFCCWLFWPPSLAAYGECSFPCCDFGASSLPTFDSRSVSLFLARPLRVSSSHSFSTLSLLVDERKMFACLRSCWCTHAVVADGSACCQIALSLSLCA